MKLPSFVIAKFVPDLNRMEPRNIGIFLWANGRLRCRFLPDSEAFFVEDKEVYRGWVDTWTKLIGGTSITDRQGASVPIADSACMRALLSQQEGEYLLVDAGELLNPISVREHQSALDCVYDDLVAVRSAQHDEKSFLRECDRVIKLSTLDQREGFRRKYPVECPIFGVNRHFQVSYGLGNGKPSAVFHRVSILSSKSVDSAALMLHALAEQKIVDKARTAALVIQSPGGSNRETEAVQLLNQVTNVVNVANSVHAASMLTAIAGK